MLCIDILYADYRLDNLLARAQISRNTFPAQSRPVRGASVVNLAARLSSQALAGQILIDPKVYAAVEAEVDAEPTGELTLKGLSRTIKAFNIKGLRAP
jgi:class 3 adenylate cyclase